MGSASAVAALTALALLFHTWPGAAARPLMRPASSETSSPFALAPSAPSVGPQWRAGAAARAGKWLPYGGHGFHYPYYPVPGYPTKKPMMWAAAGSPPALGAFNAGGQLMKDPYGSDVTQQEQVAMWASLLNPSQTQKPTTWLPPNGETAEEHAEPKGSVPAEEGRELDVPAGGEGVQASLPKWGFYSGNTNGK